MTNFLKPGKIAIIAVDSCSWGSGGKGKFNAFIATNESIDYAISNNSAQASHVVEFENEEVARRMTRLKRGVTSYKFNHLPVSSLSKSINKVFLTGSCVINLPKLLEEIETVGLDKSELRIHPNAVIITEDDVKTEQEELNQIASTMSGIAPAMCKKIMRSGKAKIASHCKELEPYISNIYDEICSCAKEGDSGVLEMAQGYDLSIDHGVYTKKDGSIHSFYPFTTGRNVDPLSFAGAAGIPAHLIGEIAMNIRSYGIRVGDCSTGTGVDERSGKKLGSSGGCYPDQKEITWEEISSILGKDVTEKTSLTKRIRRVFTFSNIQFRNATRSIGPTTIFLNFANYIDPEIEGVYGDMTDMELSNRYPKVYDFMWSAANNHFWKETRKAFKDFSLIGTGKYNHQVIRLIHEN